MARTVPPTLRSLTRDLVAFARPIDWAGLPETTRASAQRHVTDTLGVMIAGTGEDVFGAAEKLLRAHTGGGRFVAPGCADTYDIFTATYLGGVAGHSLELDDGYRLGSTHPGTVVVPAALSAARLAGASASDMLAAVVTGYEAQTLIARVAHPALRNQGFHSTAVIGVFAAAATAAHLLELDEAQWHHAFGMAASSASGLFAFINGGGDIKRLHPGHAAREGLYAALLARDGLIGPPDVLENRDGFLQGFAQGLADHPPSPEARTFYPDRPYGIDDCYIKPFPCCRHLHPAIEGLLDLRREHGFTADDVTRVDITTYDIAARHADIGAGDFASAQLSFRYTMATALRHGAVALEHFSSEARADAATLSLQDRFHVEASAEMDAAYRGNERPASVRVETRNDRYERTIHHPLGSPQSPLDAAGCEAKFTDLVTSRLGAERAAALWKRCETLATLDDIDELLALTRP